MKELVNHRPEGATNGSHEQSVIILAKAPCRCSPIVIVLELDLFNPAGYPKVIEAYLRGGSRRGGEIIAGSEIEDEFEDDYEGESMIEDESTRDRGSR